MHPSLARLYQAAASLTPAVKGKSAIASWLNESPQTVNNWEKRGVSRAGALAAQQLSGYTATWILTGEGEPLLQPSLSPVERPKGSLFDDLTEDEQRLLDNFRVMLDDDQARYADEIADKAAKMRAYTAKVIEKVAGAHTRGARTSADAKRTEMARAALDVTERLRQESLFHPVKKQ